MDFEAVRTMRNGEKCPELGFSHRFSLLLTTSHFLTHFPPYVVGGMRKAEKRSAENDLQSKPEDRREVTSVLVQTDQAENGKSGSDQQRAPVPADHETKSSMSIYETSLR